MLWLLGVDGGADIKTSVLVGIYKRISKDQLQPEIDHTSKLIAVDNSIIGIHKPVLTSFIYQFAIQVFIIRDTIVIISK